MPNSKEAIELKGNRPTNLIDSVNKFAAKFSAVGLKKVIEKLIFGHQNTFTEDRKITDTTLFANEVLDWQLKKRGIHPSFVSWT